MGEAKQKLISSRSVARWHRIESLLVAPETKITADDNDDDTWNTWFESFVSLRTVAAFVLSTPHPAAINTVPLDERRALNTRWPADRCRINNTNAVDTSRPGPMFLDATRCVPAERSKRNWTYPLTNSHFATRVHHLDLTSTRTPTSLSV